MKKHILGFFAVTIFFSCSKNSEIEPEAPHSLEDLGCMLTQVEFKYFGSIIDEYTYNFEYDNNGNLTKLYGPKKYLNSEYVYSLPFTYQDQQLVSATDHSDGVQTDEYDYSFIYEGAKISVVRTVEKESPEYYTNQKFIYNDKQIIGLEIFSNRFQDISKINDDPFLWRNYEFIYDGGNVIKLILKQYQETGQLLYERTLDIVYDKKINPLKGNVAWFILNRPIEQFLSKNNPIDFHQVHVTSPDDAKTTTWSAKYQYNNDGLPISSTVEWGINMIGNFTFSYKCE